MKPARGVSSKQWDFNFYLIWQFSREAGIELETLSTIVHWLYHCTIASQKNCCDFYLFLTHIQSWMSWYQFSWCESCCGVRCFMESMSWRSSCLQVRKNSFRKEILRIYVEDLFDQVLLGWLPPWISNWFNLDP